MSAFFIMIILGSVLSTIFVMAALILSSRVNQTENYIEELNQRNLSQGLSSQQPTNNSS